jgi:hypothetical protein
MKTETSLQRIAFRIFTILILLVFFAAGAHSVMAQCPPGILGIKGFAENALGECILTDTVKLKNTLTLPSNTTLNCQDHILAPIPPPSPLPSPLPSPSPPPQVAIFLNGAQNVVIKNCRIFGFDFGIFAINSKRIPGSATPPIRILHNKVIDARFVDISLMSVDDAEIRGNSLTVRKKGGRGLYVGRNSDRNRILGNSIKVIIPSADTTRVVRAPGPETSDLGANPIMGPASSKAKEGSAVLITQTEGPEPILLNVIIEGRLHQLFFETPTPDFSEDNVFDGNTILMLGVTAVDGVVLAVPERTLVSNNRITGAKNSIRVGIQDVITKRFPGACRNGDPHPDPDFNPPSPHPRKCLAPEDCKIPFFDTVGLGPCDSPAPKTENISWLSPDTTIQDNQIRGTFDNGIGTLGVRSIITHNTISGSLRDPSAGGGIVLVGFYAIDGTIAGTTEADAAIVTRNTVHTQTSLLLSQSGLIAPVKPALEFHAKIGLNDFTRYTTRAVLTKEFGGGLYSIALTELSATVENLGISRGNYWGTPCPKGLLPGGLLPIFVRPPNPTITDKNPFGSRVAGFPGLTPCK